MAAEIASPLQPAVRISGTVQQKTAADARTTVGRLASTALAQLRVGEQAVITAVADGSQTMRRIASLGFVPGTRVRVVRVAPLGDPTEYEVRGTRVSLRRTETQRIQVRPDESR